MALFSRYRPRYIFTECPARFTQKCSRNVVNIFLYVSEFVKTSVFLQDDFASFYFNREQLSKQGVTK